MVKSETPGYKPKRNHDGSIREYWVARDDLVARGYRPKLVRLHYDKTPDGRRQLAARCQILQAEMLAWASGGDRLPPRGYDGTIASVCRLFEVNEDSPFATMKFNSQENIGKTLKIIVNSVGARHVAHLLGPDFTRWHAKWGEPVEDGAKPRPWRAKHAMDVVRQVIAYGVTLGFEDCMRADLILSKKRFPTPPARTEQLTLVHLLALRPVAREMGRASIARATVFQHELALRQKDVIGEWAPGPGGIAFGGRHWQTGLTWSHISDDYILRKVTSKKGVFVEHDLKLSPLVMEEISLVPREQRVGPLIIDESTGQPYKNRRFSDVFRIVARGAGIPDQVKNMDARSGAISELYDAGASETDTMKTAGHQDPRMSARYNRSSLTQTRRAAIARHGKRAGNADREREGDV